MSRVTLWVKTDVSHQEYAVTTQGTERGGRVKRLERLPVRQRDMRVRVNQTRQREPSREGLSPIDRREGEPTISDPDVPPIAFAQKRRWDSPSLLRRGPAS